MFRFFRSFAPLFTPPFDGLGFIVILYVIWAHLVFPHNDLLRGNLPDPDDYMYLTQVLDWVKGQGWYDNIQHRLDYPTGTPIHFSRLAQMPLAAGIFFFHRLGLPLRGAATVTALIEPLVLLGLLMFVMRRVMSRLITHRWAGLSAYVVLFSPALLFEFMPGHVDHHGLVILLMMATVGCLLRLLEPPHDLKAAAMSGVILGIGMMIALECLPWVLLIAAFLGVWAMRQGKQAARGGAVFALTYLITSIVCLGFTRPPSEWLNTDILTYSLVYVFLAAGIGLPFIGVAATANAKPVIRWMVGIVLAAVGGGLFLHHFPDMMTGPYGGIDPQLYAILLDAVDEAKPITHMENGWMKIVSYMLMSLLALPLALSFFRHAKKTERWKWALVGLMLVAAVALTIFYQYRFLGMSCAMAILPLTAFAAKGWAWIGENLKDRKKVFAEIGLLLLVGPLPAILVPALFDSRSFNTGFFLFPVDAGHTPCDMAKLEHILRDPDGLGDKPHLILNMEGNGPELLFRTDDRILSAPFHMDVQGNLDATRFFSTIYESEAQNIAQRRGTDLVVACRFVPDFYMSEYKANKNGDNTAPLPLIARMMRGTQPSWLEHISEPGLDNFLIYKIHPLQSLTPATKAQRVKK